ncbi:very short patch repair endonuclease [Agaricicola taiwanensis]|uniref:Very short patch repair endonuclease n=1 Tax=Agaricicola taiwanensis TaxID=591372 RepID=A0A8J3DYB1_9RHOB|nr:very short patch repair endonuclease [Agaricicola taiwanensis]GGE53100.1 very short patch repair endonuclease [Agaricicola taiwanensis]
MDKISPNRRSANMRAIRSKNTKPELAVRALLRRAGFVGYRLHRPDLPGRPDIAFIKWKKAIFVHGCFWHGHNCKTGTRKPDSHQDYWLPKIEGNRQRDLRDVAALAGAGWNVMTVWECEIRDPFLSDRLTNFLAQHPQRS